MSALDSQLVSSPTQPDPAVGNLIGVFTGSKWWPSARQVARLSLVLQGLLVFVVCYGFHAQLAPYGVDPHHDGIMFKPALDVSQGKMVFRDTFTQYGGVTVLLQAAALKVFGARLVVIKMQTAVTYGLCFLVFWRAWSRLVPSPIAVMLCLVGAVLGPDSVAEALPWSSVFALLFQALALLLAMRYLERGRDVELVLSGASAALAFWCRQPVGVFLAAGMLGALLVISLRMPPRYAELPGKYSMRLFFGDDWRGRALSAMLLYGGGFVLVNAVIMLWLASYGALDHWWKQSIVLAKIWSETTGQGHSLPFVLSCLFPAGHLRMWCLLATAVVISTIRTGSPFLDPKSSNFSFNGALGLLASVVALTSWMQFYPVACNYHCYWGGIPMLGVFAYLLYSTHLSSSLVVRSSIVIVASGLLFYDDAKVRIEAVKPHIGGINVPIHGIPALEGMYSSYAEVKSYEALASLFQTYLEAYPEGTVVTGLGDGLFPALLPRQASYHPFYMNWPSITPRVYPDRHDAYVSYIKDFRPIIVGGAEDNTYVQVASLYFWGYPYYIWFPVELHPTEFVTCDASGTCQRSPLKS
ncbi:MAG TPA: glycosyltransferase family 39 protein [Polyangiaceae bacterium]